MSSGRSAVRRTLADAFYPRNNSLNALRLALAVAVIVSHAWPLTGAASAGPEFGGQDLGRWAVAGFFLISGFLITRSRDRRSLGRYAWDRFLRIYPGYVVAILVTAFVFAPVSLLVTEGTTYRLADAFVYVAKYLPLSPPYLSEQGISDTVSPATGLPWPGVWNGPIWTLFYEAICYIVVALLMTWVPRRWTGPTLLVGAVGATAASSLIVSNELVHVPSYIWAGVLLGTPFAIGSAMYWYRDRVPVGTASALAAAAVFVAVGLVDQGQSLGPWPLAIVLFFLGTTRALPLQKIGRTHDISYGVYVYGWPSQTLVMLAYLSWGIRPPVWVDIVVVLALTLPLAYASARLIEEPALRLKDYRRRGNDESPRPPLVGERGEAQVRT